METWEPRWWLNASATKCPHSLRNPIEWKLDGFAKVLNSVTGPHSLRNPIEWKLPDIEPCVLKHWMSSLAEEPN